MPAAAGTGRPPASRLSATQRMRPLSTVNWQPQTPPTSTAVTHRSVSAGARAPAPADPSRPKARWPTDPLLNRARLLTDLGLDRAALMELEMLQERADSRSWDALEGLTLSRAGQHRLGDPAPPARLPGTRRTPPGRSTGRSAATLLPARFCSRGDSEQPSGLRCPYISCWR